MKPTRILVIPDTQCKPGVDLSHLAHAGQYIVDKRPDVIVHLGDHLDMESLSEYDRGKLSFEGRRLKADIEAGQAGMEMLLSPLIDLQIKQRRNRKTVYNPRLVFCIGNHEQRIVRIPNNNPEFQGFVGYESLGLEQWGWEVHDFLKPVEIEGFYFTHYLVNPMTGRPYAGTAMSLLKTVGKSFVVGHKQTLDIAIRPTLTGELQLGLVCGAFYSHNEDYKGHQGNTHFRGMVMMNDVKNGYADLCMISIDYLKRKYGQNGL